MRFFRFLNRKAKGAFYTWKLNITFFLAICVTVFRVGTTQSKWCEPKVGTQKENREHGLEVRKIY